ncbi:MAG TPA: tyrosine recombinase XerC [Candidatus Sumerlaeota bacterium]|nr:MAG: Tyrosine recombinase XerD [candidate division BRC1 bacterium ADurb.BinA292]HPK03342.1 tyrosine recombinase XerC [Candidatus Sumerlaeota bacterium]
MAIGYLELLNRFEEFLRVERNLSPRTRKAYLYDLTRFSEFLILGHGRMPSLSLISTDVIREYLNHLQLEHACKSTTLARTISSIRAFFQFAVEREVLEASPAARIRTPKQPKKLPIYLVPQELVRLLEAPAADTWSGLRDRAILATLAFTGVRLSEVTGINLPDIDLTNRAVRVLGKGNKERIIPLNEIVCEAINRYLNVRPLSEAQALFLNKFGRRLSGRSVENIVRKYALKAGIFRDGVSPHKLRHTFATLLHANEVDLIEIKSLMGHANIASTQIYTHTSNSRLRAAVQKIENLPL